MKLFKSKSKKESIKNLIQFLQYIQPSDKLPQKRERNLKQSTIKEAEYFVSEFLALVRYRNTYSCHSCAVWKHSNSVTYKKTCKK